MAEYECIQEVVNWAAIQAVTSVMMALKDMDAGPNLAPNSRSERATAAKAWQTGPQKCLI